MCSVCGGMIRQCDCEGGDNVYFTSQDLNADRDGCDPFLPVDDEELYDRKEED